MPTFITFLFNFILPQDFFSLYGLRNGTPVGQTSLRILRLLFCDSKSALLARNYQNFGMIFFPKTIIIFNFYWVIFLGIVCGKT